MVIELKEALDLTQNSSPSRADFSFNRQQRYEPLVSKPGFMMTDQMRRFLEEQQRLNSWSDSQGLLRRHLAEAEQFDSLQRQLEQFQGSEILRTQARDFQWMAQEIEREQRLRMLAGVLPYAEQSLARAQFESDRRMYEGELEEARRLGMFDPPSEVMGSFATLVEAHSLYASRFRAANDLELMQLAVGALNDSGLQQFLRSASELEAAMSAMSAPWLQIDAELRSAQAFADIMGMGRGLALSAPFGGAFADILRHSLGDWRDEIAPMLHEYVDPTHRGIFYLERGFDPALTDFTGEAFDETIRAGGLSDVAPDDDDTDDDADVTRADYAFRELRRLEVAIRKFIDRVMQAEYGDNWMRTQLPQGMLDKWHAKRETALNAGDPDLPLLDYADFTEYKLIIERKDNWSTVFSSVFRRPEDMRESFQRLYPVRNATMHARIITQEDELLIRMETRRLTKAIQAHLR